jgi:hypothetical protein
MCEMRQIGQSKPKQGTSVGVEHTVLSLTPHSDRTSRTVTFCHGPIWESFGTPPDLNPG